MTELKNVDPPPFWFSLTKVASVEGPGRAFKRFLLGAHDAVEGKECVERPGRWASKAQSFRMVLRVGVKKHCFGAILSAASAGVLGIPANFPDEVLGAGSAKMKRDKRHA